MLLSFQEGRHLSTALQQANGREHHPGLTLVPAVGLPPSLAV